MDEQDADCETAMGPLLWLRFLQKRHPTRLRRAERSRYRPRNRPAPAEAGGGRDKIPTPKPRLSPIALKGHRRRTQNLNKSTGYDCHTGPAPVSADLIRGRDIAEIFKELGSGFAEDVANVLAKKEPTNLYDSVVSSQFDADRLDYMQRDRLMTGVQSSGIDATWLLSNLEIGSVRIVTDEEEVGTVDTLVLGPKAFRAAENYVLSLFQLYPNIYLHKTTRAAEKLFSCLMYRVFELVRSRHVGKVGLPKGHPIRRFVENPENIDNALTLDDAVFWGALPMMADAKDPLVRNCAAQLRERRLPKCIDIRQIVDEHAAIDMEVDLRQARIARSCKEIVERIQVFAQTRRPDQPQIFIDEARRAPYKKVEDSESPLNQILIKHGESRFEDMARLSPVVESAETFVVCRAYHEAGDTEGRSVIENIIKTQNRNAEDG